MNIGLGQTGSTCWFNSSLNMFLMSDSGLKILWQKLQDVYTGLGPKKKEFFNSYFGALCPYRGSIQKTSSIYFWKFLNQYICAFGGPGRLLPKSGLNAQLTANIPWKGAAARESRGTSGAWPRDELPVILRHLGFKQGGVSTRGDFRINNFDRWIYRFKRPEWTEPIMLFRGDYIPIRDLMREKKGYELTGAIVYRRTRGTNSAHVWSCSIRNNKGYIYDSNTPIVSTECSWWQKEELAKFFNDGSNTAVISFEIIMYTRKSFTNKITMSCIRPRDYNSLTAQNEMNVGKLSGWGNSMANFLKTGKVGIAHVTFSPLVRAEFVRRNARKPPMTATQLNGIVKTSTSFQNGLSLANSLGLRYKINKTGRNFYNFKHKLISKFPRAMPKNRYENVWKNSKTNKEAMNRIKEIANKGGYTMPNLQTMVNRRASTRAGTKRSEERMYKVGNNWFNNNGKNVTANINTNNWVRTNASSNAQVYKRK